MVLVVAACDGGAGTPVDAPRPPPDAWVPPPPPRTCPGAPEIQKARCVEGVALASVHRYTPGAGTHSMCFEQLFLDTATCSAGCAITGEVYFGTSAPEVQLFGAAARVLCTETVEAHAGQACNASGARPCLPTRARLAADGTVAGQDYLACDATSETCVAAAAPTYPGYLEACDATTLATYGTASANGVVPFYGELRACLLAWDDAAQRITSGKTRACVGDWQCPAGALCDDQLARLGASTAPVAVCKPGPRGVLTPAMLTP